MRAGIIRKALLHLADHPIFSQWLKDKPYLENTNELFLTDYILGIGRKINKTAWYFKECTQQPTRREARIILKTFCQFLEANNLHPTKYLRDPVND